MKRWKIGEENPRKKKKENIWRRKITFWDKKEKKEDNNWDLSVPDRSDIHMMI